MVKRCRCVAFIYPDCPILRSWKLELHSLVQHHSKSWNWRTLRLGCQKKFILTLNICTKSPIVSPSHVLHNLTIWSLSTLLLFNITMAQYFFFFKNTLITCLHSQFANIEWRNDIKWRDLSIFVNFGTTNVIIWTRFLHPIINDSVIYVICFTNLLH